MQTQGFPPVYRTDSRVLILGSLPGVESVRMQQYYAHPRNLFWKILASVLNERQPVTYDEKLHLLHRHHMALWDVLHSSYRAGSLDSAIQHGSERANAIDELLIACPNLRAIFFNGQKAMGLFNKFVPSPLTRHVDLISLPSSSPANAGVSQHTKIEKWSAIRQYVD